MQTFCTLDSENNLSKEGPEFVELMPNLTRVALGRDAKIHCLINNLETYSVCIVKRIKHLKHNLLSLLYGFEKT